MSSGEVKKVSREDIQLVQNLIERCLQLYMSKNEAVDTLLHQAKIEPSFTELVWQRLEEENQEFFIAYRLRLIVKGQILRFNELLERQVELMHQTCPTGVASVPMPNESLFPSLHQNSLVHPPEHVAPAKAENMQPPVNANIHNLYTEGASSLQPCLQRAVDLPAHARRIDMSSNIVPAHASNMGMMIQGLNGGMVKPEAGYAGNPAFMFGSDNNVQLHTRPTIGDASVSSFRNLESNSLPLNETILDPDTFSLGVLGQMSRSFSLSDLAADLTNYSDILESYSRSPFLGTDTDNFVDPHGPRE